MLARAKILQIGFFKVPIFILVCVLVKFIYSEKATKFLRNLHRRFDRYYSTWDKSKVEISQDFVAFSEYLNFKYINKSYQISKRKGVFWHITSINCIRSKDSVSS